MDRKPTIEEIRRFQGYDKPRVKKPIQECQLVDRFGNIHARGTYALCQWKKKQLGGQLTINIIRW